MRRRPMPCGCGCRPTGWVKRRLKLKPGMPADVFIQTRTRSPLSYLLQPLSDQMARSFRES
jgi:hypothetical protein